jgi:hypothetical protein
MTTPWSSAATSRTLGLCVSVALLTSRKNPEPPLTLICPHDSSFQADYLTRGVALSQQFSQTTGIQGQRCPVPEGTREQLTCFRGLLQRTPAGLDLLETDCAAITFPDWLSAQIGSSLRAGPTDDIRRSDTIRSDRCFFLTRELRAITHGDFVELAGCG